MDIYEELLKGASSIPNEEEINGVDAFIQGNNKVASWLQGESKEAEDKLVRKALKDLWSVNSDEEGNASIERLFNNGDGPIAV